MKNTALTHRPEERGAMKALWGGESRRCLAKGEELLLARPLPSPFSNSCSHPRAAHFFLYPTQQSPANLKNKRCSLAGISNAVIKKGGNFSPPWADRAGSG